MASANSRGDAEGCGRGFIQAATATLLVSCVLVCVLLSAPEQLLGMFQNDPEVLALAKTYCIIRCQPAASASAGSIAK
jgi:Na+-driven multidrug efflux pump